MTGKNKGILQMLVCATLWSIAGIFIKLIDANPFVIAGFRSLFAAITVFCYIKISNTRIVVSKRSVLNGAILCMLFFMFVGSNKLTTAANAIVLQFTSPIFLMIYSALIFKKKFRKIDIFAAIFTLIGVGLCFADELEGGHLLGNIIAVGSGAVMGGMFLTIGDTKDFGEKITGILLGQTFTAVVGISFLLFTTSNLKPVSFVYLAILGIFQLGIPYVLYGLSTKNCPPLACSLLAAMEPLLNPIWVAIFDGERPGIMALFGGVVVIASVTIWCILDAKGK